jgi:hypothetical protein
MENKINYLFEQFKKTDEEELQSHILNYICILLSGYIETNINNIIKQCKKDLDNECKNSISSTQNATWCKIKPILSLIDIELTLKLHNAIIETDTIDIIFHIVNKRNDISHGKDVTGLTLQQLENDFKKLKLFIQKVKEIFIDRV